MISVPNSLDSAFTADQSRLHTVAIIGAGSIARNRHIPAWLKLSKKVRVAAVCDTDLRRAESLATAFKVPLAYSDVDRMLKELAPDFVDVCTPPTAHVEPVIAALDAGSEVLVEKPLSTTVEDCERIMAVERRSPGRVSVAHSELYYEPIIEAHNRLRRGDIGELKGIRHFRSTPVSAMTSDRSHWAHSLPGGTIGETGPHVVYLSQSFVGPIYGISASARKVLPQYPWSQYEDYRIELKGESADSSAVITYVNDHSAAHIDLWGTDGIFRIDLQGRVLVDYDRRGNRPWTIGTSVLCEGLQFGLGAVSNATSYLLGRFRNPHERLISDFYERRVKGLEPRITSEGGLETVQVMDRITRHLDETDR